jgi:hypothetical protein
MLAWRQIGSRKISLKLLINVAECNLAQQDKPNIINPGSKTIVSAFTDHISKIDSLAKHVSGTGRFKGCNPQALTQYADIIGQSTSMPEQMSISEFNPFVIKFILLFPYLKDLLYFKGVFAVGWGVGRNHVLD